MKRGLKSFLIISLFVMTSVARAGGDFAAFEGVGEYVLRNTETGASLVARITGVTEAEIGDMTFSSFRQRMTWAKARPLRNELAQDLRKIETELAEYRASKGRKPLEPGERLLPDETEFLKRASASLKSNRIENLLTEAVSFVEAPRVGARGGSYAANRGAFLAPEARAPHVADPHVEGPKAPATRAARPADPSVGDHPNVPAQDDVPALPIPEGVDPASIPNLEGAKLAWHKQIGIRFRAYRGFFRAFRMSEGDWRTIIGLKGKPFTPNDLAVIRKYNRLLEGLNDYAQMRLVVRSFANERSVLYTKLNEATAEATQTFLDGTMSMEDYLKTRVEAATRLGMNDVVGEAEKRMLQAVERCKILAGGKTAGRETPGLIEPVEANAKAYQDHIQQIEGWLEKNGKELKALRKAEPRSPRIAELERQILKDTADRDLWRGRLDTAARTLEGYYAEFTQYHDLLDQFTHLRGGRINSEIVTPFDLPDPFVPSPEELARWNLLDDRALYNSTNKLVIGETKLFFKTRVGKTRLFIRQLNEQSAKVLGKKFTDTHFGTEFKAYGEKLGVTVVKRIGAIVGVTVPTAYGAKYADKAFNWLFSLDGSGNTPAPDADTSAAPAVTTTTTTTVAPAPAGVPAADPAPAPATTSTTDTGSGSSATQFPPDDDQEPEAP